MMKNEIGRKGDSVWISWVMITVFMIALGAFIYSWSASYARESAQNVEDRAYRQECDSVAINIVDTCQRNSSIDITIANTKDTNVDKVIFNLFDIFGGAESREQVLSVPTGGQSAFRVLKQGTISTIKAVPAMNKKGRWIVCSEKEAEYSGVRYC
jgi:archaellum component FlaF (FlaF/FlaG flagellin family)